MSTTDTPVCRICLAMGMRMFTITGPLQTVYERLTSTTLHTDGKPEAACYICYAQLRKCQKFMLKATKAENMLNLLLEKNLMITNKSISLIDRSTTGLCESLVPCTVECFDHTEFATAKVKTEHCLKEEVNIKDESKELGDSMLPLKELVSGCSDEILDSGQDDPERVQQLCEIDIAMGEEVSEGGQLLSSTASSNVEEILHSIKEDSIIPVEWDTMSETHVNEAISEDTSPAVKTEPGQENQTGERSEAQNAEESYECAVCNLTFFNNADLLYHFRSVHVSQASEKPFKCRICDCRFSRHSDMLNHLRNHTGGKPDYQKQTVNVLKNHTGGKQYSCHICQKECIGKYELMRHVRTHTGEHCDTCERLYCNETKFLSHMSTHNTDKPYPCEICHRRFNLEENLIKHCKKSYW